MQHCCVCRAYLGSPQTGQHHGRTPLPVLLQQQHHYHHQHHHNAACGRRKLRLQVGALPQEQHSEREQQAAVAVETSRAAAVDWVATGTCFIFPAIAGLLFGYDIGASSGVLASLTSPAVSGTDWGPAITSSQSGLLVGMSLFGALAGSLMTLLASNSFGRRTELLIASALYALGALVMGASTQLDMLFAGRALYGLGAGFAMHAAPAYIAETAPASVRGLLVSFKEVAIVLGILLGYIVSYSASEDVAGWRVMYDTAIPLALVLAAGMSFLPESPRWLLLAGKGRQAAAEALRRAEGTRASSQPSYVDTQLDQIAQSLAVSSAAPVAASQSMTSSCDGSSSESLTQLSTTNSSPASSPATIWVLAESKYWRPLAVGCSLMLFQQVTGQPSVLYRAASILQEAGFEAGKGAASVAVLLGSFKVLMTLVAVAKVDSMGRRPLLLTGASGMVLALLALSAAQSDVLQAQLAASDLGGPAPLTACISVAALLLYVGCYQVSFGPISWLMVGELFPLRVRSQAIAVAALVNFGGNFAVSSALPVLLDTYGTSSTYLMFAVLGMVAVACMSATVPETKGKTLEEIEATWGSSDSSNSGGGSAMAS